MADRFICRISDDPKIEFRTDGLNYILAEHHVDPKTGNWAKKVHKSFFGKFSHLLRALIDRLHQHRMQKHVDDLDHACRLYVEIARDVASKGADAWEKLRGVEDV